MATSTYFKTFVDATYPSITGAIFKCLPVTALIVFVFLCQRKIQANIKYSRKIAIGLAFSAVGDVFLTWKDDFTCFLIGMVVFGIAHFLYAFAFGTKPFSAYIGIVLCINGAAIYYYLLPDLHGIFAPACLVYILLITYMVWRSFARLELAKFSWTWPRMFGAVGSTLFFISDLYIALDKFKFSVPYAQHIIMATYYAAQLGISASVLDRKI